MKMFQINITSPALQHREKKFFFREIKIKLNFIFEVCDNEFCFFVENIFLISLVVLSSRGLRETSRVDYTERRKTERKKENVSNEHYITPAHHREKNY